MCAVTKPFAGIPRSDPGIIHPGKGPLVKGERSRRELLFSEDALVQYREAPQTRRVGSEGTNPKRPIARQRATLAQSRFQLPPDASC